MNIGLFLRAKTIHQRIAKKGSVFGLPKLGPITNCAMGSIAGAKKGLVTGAPKLLDACFATEECKPRVYVWFLSVVVGERARATLPGVLRNRFHYIQLSMTSWCVRAHKKHATVGPKKRGPFLVPKNWGRLV